MSLAGLIDEPARHLSNLLRSGQPIEARTRQKLADLLDGRASAVRLQISLTRENKVVRAFRKARRDLQIGRRVAEMMNDKKSYAGAISEVARTSNLGEKSVQRCYTEMQKFNHWSANCRASGLDFSDLALEAAFAYSKAKSIKPAEAIKPLIEQLGRLAELFESILADAEGLRPSGHFSRSSSIR